MIIKHASVAPSLKSSKYIDIYVCVEGITIKRGLKYLLYDNIYMRY
jgi:hypothetical protein